MNPTDEQIKEFWEGCGIKHMKHQGDDGWIRPDIDFAFSSPPKIDLNNLSLYAPEIIVGIEFRYYPGGCKCIVTYITEGGFDTALSWVKNETGIESESRKLSALALFWACYKAFGLGGNQ